MFQQFDPHTQKMIFLLGAQSHWTCLLASDWMIAHICLPQSTGLKRAPGSGINVFPCLNDYQSGKISASPYIPFLFSPFRFGLFWTWSKDPFQVKLLSRTSFGVKTCMLNYKSLQIVVYWSKNVFLLKLNICINWTHFRRLYMVQ